MHGSKHKKNILALTMASAILAFSTHAHALLGALSVQSSLGQPLQAQIEIPQISSEQAASFQAQIGSLQSFEQAGLTYNPALAGVGVSLHKKQNGQSYLLLKGNRPINEPIIGLVVEASWAGGNITRDYTLFLDPKPIPPAVADTQDQPRQTQGLTPAQIQPAPSVAEQLKPAAARTSAPAPAPTAQKPAPGKKKTTKTAPRANAQGRLTVRAGDTLSAIAAATGLRGISLDQMMIAILKANPDAFIDGNINLVKSGAALQIPSSDQARNVSRQDARELVQAQIRSFENYRRGLASSAAVALAQDDNSRQSSSGQVQTQIQETSAPADSPDKLKLSKAAGEKSPVADETQAASQRQSSAESRRLAELDKNLDELSALREQLEDVTKQANTSSDSESKGLALPLAQTSDEDNTEHDSSALPTPDEQKTGSDAVKSHKTQDISDSEVQAEGTQASAQADQTANHDSPSETQPEAKTPPASQSKPTFWSGLLDNKPLMYGLAAILALLAFLGLYRSRRNKDDDDAFGWHPEPNLDGSAHVLDGAVTDTDPSISANKTKSSDHRVLSNSPSSQLETADNMDTLAEADAYLAYGKDDEAEQILKQALAFEPERMAIYQKLAEIYAQRKDAHALEQMARKARDVSDGSGSEWQTIARLGRDLQAGNDLYSDLYSSLDEETPTATKDDALIPPESQASGKDSELRQDSPEDWGLPTNFPPLDLDLDLDLDIEPESAPFAPAASHAPTPDDLPDQHSSSEASSSDSVLPIDFSKLPDLSLPPKKSAETENSFDPSGMIEFDMSDLLEDNGTDSDALQTDNPQDSTASSDPLAVKLALAREFRSIGDLEAARKLAREVIEQAEADAQINQKAQSFLQELDD